MREPVFLLAGLLCDSTIWKHQLTSLSDKREVRAVDFQAFDSIISMAQSVLDLAPSRFALAGHSMGARVALEVLRLAPMRVTRIALLDTGTHGVRLGEQQSRQILVDLADRQGMAALAKQWLPPMMLPENAANPQLYLPLEQMVHRMTPDIYRRQVHALLHRRDASEQLPAITCPCLVGVGRQDAWSCLSQHEAIAARIPHANLRIFENSGHMSPFEAPEQVTRALSDWLEWSAIDMTGSDT